VSFNHRDRHGSRCPLLTRELEASIPPNSDGHGHAAAQGAFSLASVFAGRPDILVGPGVARRWPWAMARRDYLGSDALALAPFTQRIAYLEEDD